MRSLLSVTESVVPVGKAWEKLKSPLMVLVRRTGTPLTVRLEERLGVVLEITVGG